MSNESKKEQKETKTSTDNNIDDGTNNNTNQLTKTTNNIAKNLTVQQQEILDSDEQKLPLISLSTSTPTTNPNNDNPQPDEAANDDQANRPKVSDEMSSAQCVFDEQTGEQILQRDIPNKIIVARGKKISFYYERARRVLRLFDGMIVTGFGATVCIACSLVEVLKRNQMAEIIYIQTKFETPIQSAPPQPAIEFHLKVGKYGKYLSGYHQRKVIELFEKYDCLTGLVTVSDVKSMNLYQVFHANNNQIVSAEQFINNKHNLHGANNQLILPDFIKYCSLIIHPLMKDNIFKKILYQNFKIGNYYNLLNRGINDNDMGLNDTKDDRNVLDLQTDNQQNTDKSHNNDDKENVDQTKQN